MVSSEFLFSVIVDKKAIVDKISIMNIKQQAHTKMLAAARIILTSQDRRVSTYE